MVTAALIRGIWAEVKNREEAGLTPIASELDSQTCLRVPGFGFLRPAALAAMPPPGGNGPAFAPAQRTAGRPRGAVVGARITA